MKKHLAFLLFSLNLLPVLAQVQLDPAMQDYLPANTSYNDQIPLPEDIIGFVPGKWHVSHDKLIEYMKALSVASDRIQIENRGKTYEDRGLYLLTISSPSNLRNLEEIRTNHLKNTTSDQIDNSTAPIVVYQGFSIHGNEPSGSNAALILAYHLAAAEGPEIESLLNNTVILLDPSLNPDGLQRFAGWVNQHKSDLVNPDNYDREYDEVWPGGRTNHYWFDMNRDWLPAQLPESQARIATFHKWLPNILTDHHEMGTNATFFFQPGIPSRTHPLTPKMNQELTRRIGEYHARAFDKIGSLYYTEESYDDFYYGKGSTFPDINGSVGILFEQASSRGHAQESENGILTFPFTIKNQFTAALSTLEAAQGMRAELLNYQKDFYTNARKEAGKDAYIFGDATDANRTKALADILSRHQIKLKPVNQDFTKNGKLFKKGYAFMVPKNQKNSRLLQAMFEKRTEFQDSLFYDISAWTLPLAFDMDFEEQGSLDLAGSMSDMEESPRVEKSDFAYLLRYNDYYAPAALYQILSEGIRAKVAMQPFGLSDRNYDYGTILIPVMNQEKNAEELEVFLKNLSKRFNINFEAAPTGLTSGIDLGSRQFRALELPKIAVLIGEGINPYDAGEIWHLMDQRYQIPITKIDLQDINRKDLNKYTTIVVPATAAQKMR
ncbi:M14 metallopeptidase family protein [Nonlabens xiamenensis]|uniref:M14 metallopeptidase family protein n=1 Tax=Nonlabens xiamenensis TaxID=2341043 RepID=UPI002938FE73|nr:M14 family metallopeptidase [Nonlabens xiamenensis]